MIPSVSTNSLAHRHGKITHSTCWQPMLVMQSPGFTSMMLDTSPTVGSCWKRLSSVDRLAAPWNQFTVTFGKLICRHSKVRFSSLYFFLHQSDTADEFADRGSSVAEVVASEFDKVASWSNSTINGLLYVLLYKHNRKNFRRLFSTSAVRGCAVCRTGGDSGGDSSVCTSVAVS